MQTYDPNNGNFIDPNDTADRTTTAVDVAVEVAKNVAPVIAATNPKAAVVVAAAEEAVSLLQQAIALQKSGTIGPGTLAALFENVGRDIQSKHVQWTAQP